MAGYVYILESQKNGKFYIGSSENIDRRLKEHRNGRVTLTKGLRPLSLIFKQAYPDLNVVKHIEQRLKKLKRKDYIKKIISDGIIKIS